MISTSTAGHSLLVLFALLFVFHCFVLWGLVPKDIVWAGKIKSRAELIKLESVSLLILSISALLVAIKMQYLNLIQNATVINIAMWLLFALFALNTMGNMTAKNAFEKYGFGFLTFIMALLALRLALGDQIITG